MGLVDIARRQAWPRRRSTTRTRPAESARPRSRARSASDMRRGLPLSPAYPKAITSVARAISQNGTSDVLGGRLRRAGGTTRQLPGLVLRTDRSCHEIIANHTRDAISRRLDDPPGPAVLARRPPVRRRPSRPRRPRPPRCLTAQGLPVVRVGREHLLRPGQHVGPQPQKSVAPQCRHEPSGQFDIAVLDGHPKADRRSATSAASISAKT